MVWTRPILGASKPRQVHYTTITRGNAVVGTSTKEVVTDMSTYVNTYNIVAYGYDGGSDYYAYGPGFGSIADGTYVDNLGQTRLIDSCYFIDGTGQPMEADFMYLVLDGLSIPNSDNVFERIVIDNDPVNNTFYRADAFYSASVDGGTMWEWSYDIGIGGRSDPFAGPPGDYDLEVWVKR